MAGVNFGNFLKNIFSPPRSAEPKKSEPANKPVAAPSSQGAQNLFKKDEFTPPAAPRQSSPALAAVPAETLKSGGGPGAQAVTTTAQAVTTTTTGEPATPLPAGPPTKKKDSFLEKLEKDLEKWAKNTFDPKVKVTSNDDDPFAKESGTEYLDRRDFDQDDRGNPVGLKGPRAKVEDEDVIYREDPETGDYIPFANNPWQQPKPANNGDFLSSKDEARFPVHEIERGPDGKPVIDERGLQVWKPKDQVKGMTTAFEALNTVNKAAESWAGRPVKWGDDGKLTVNSHAFIDFNAFYSPSANQLFMGIVPYRLPGEDKTQPVKMFELASSWEIVAHESGHAAHAELKPNRDFTDQGYRTWGESFSDQTAMWSSLKDPGRVKALLKEVDGKMDGSNSLTRIGEAFAGLVGEGTGLRDAFHDKKISNTSEEVHARSEVLTGAAYKIFQNVYQDKLSSGMPREQAMMEAGDVMGRMNVRSTDYTPETSMTLEDVGKAYLKVDKEYFGGKYGKVIADEMVRREIFDGGSVAEFNAHEAAVPALTLRKASDADKLLKSSVDALRIPPEYGLKVQSAETDQDGRIIVRAQLTEGRGKDATALDNYGVMVFRRDGTLADWHSAFPEGVTASQATQALQAAREEGLDQKGVPLSLVRGADGQLEAEARVLRSGNGINGWVEAFTTRQPDGERRELRDADHAEHYKDLLPEGAVILTAADLQTPDAEDGERQAAGLPALQPAPDPRELEAAKKNASPGTGG